MDDKINELILTCMAKAYDLRDNGESNGTLNALVECVTRIRETEIDAWRMIEEMKTTDGTKTILKRAIKHMKSDLRHGTTASMKLTPDANKFTMGNY